ncbi:MAG: hypothetical protein QOD72_1765 [Acidimicrobiaceae bacterium]|jgi:hypothetical protein|nr:hypothetical protein [Acidimicrobiaceae bacterium]
MRCCAIESNGRTTRSDLATEHPNQEDSAAVAASFINTREAIIEKAAPLLEPGEVVAHVIRGMQGMNRWLGMLIAIVVAFPIGLFVPPIFIVPIYYLLFTGMYPRRIILATDDALVVLAGGRLRYAPKSVLDRLDVETPLGPMRGTFWRFVVLNGRRVYIVPRSYPEVVAADADLSE